MARWQSALGAAALLGAGLLGGWGAAGVAPASSATVAPKAGAPVDPKLLAAGKKAFLSVGCAGCHTLTAAGSKGAVGPNLDHIGKIRSAKWILVQIADPCARGHEHAAGPYYSCLAMPPGLAKGKTALAIATFLAAQK